MGPASPKHIGQKPEPTGGKQNGDRCGSGSLGRALIYLAPYHGPNVVVGPRIFGVLPICEMWLLRAGQ